MKYLYKIIFIFFLTSQSNIFAAALKIDINTALPRNLERRLLGCGPELAKSIVSFRTKNGPFQSYEEIEKAPHIGSSWIAKNKDKIIITNEYRCGYCGRVNTFNKGDTEGQCRSCKKWWPEKKMEPKTDKNLTKKILKRPYHLIKLNNDIVITGKLSIRLKYNLKRTMAALKVDLNDLSYEYDLNKCLNSRIFYIFDPKNGLRLNFLDGKVYYIECSKKFKGSLAGIRIGNTKDSVSSRFGKAKIEKPFHLVYKHLGQDIGILFDHSTNEVSSIRIYTTKSFQRAAKIRHELKEKREQ